MRYALSRRLAVLAGDSVIRHRSYDERLGTMACLAQPRNATTEIRSTITLIAMRARLKCQVVLEPPAREFTHDDT